jgi:hypothetical protein
LQNFKAFANAAVSSQLTFQLRVSSSPANNGTMGNSTIGTCVIPNGGTSCTGSGTQAIAANTLVGTVLTAASSGTYLTYVSVECK